MKIKPTAREDNPMLKRSLPSDWYSPLMQDPFGFSALFSGEKYAATNRFFAHGFMSVYFKNIPGFLQHFASPIDSVFLACAFLKTGVQLLIAWLLASFVSGTSKPSKIDFLLAAVLIMPLFQHTAYQGIMGIIDKSVTYTCFYALPLGFLLLFFYPFYKSISLDQSWQLNFFQKTMLAVLALVLAFSGPLVPPTVLILCALLLFYFWKKPADEAAGMSLEKRVLMTLRRMPGLLLFFSLLCLYSLYIGTFNAEHNNTVPILERYARLPAGIFNLLTMRLGLPLLLIFTLVNVFILKKQKADGRAAGILTTLNWVAVFSLIFILLLPLGGYREYRPDIVRRDTIMPVLLGLMYAFGASTFYLLKQLPARHKMAYRIAVGVLLLIFMNADWSLVDESRCQRAALGKIARSPEPIVRIDHNCMLLSWTNISDYRDSELNSRLLEIWGVTEEAKLYYQEPGH